MTTICQKKNARRNVDELGNGLDELPDLFLVGPWVDGTSLGSANVEASQALLGVYLQKMKVPQQMLGPAVVEEESVLNDEPPKKLNNPHTCSEELAEEPCLRHPGTGAISCLVLDVPGDSREVGKLVDNVRDNVEHTVIEVVMVVLSHAGGGDE
jgi:hypothetical protein